MRIHMHALDGSLLLRRVEIVRGLVCCDLDLSLEHYVISQRNNSVLTGSAAFTKRTSLQSVIGAVEGHDPGSNW